MDISFKFDPEVLIGADTLSMAGPVCSRYGERIMIAADHTLDPELINRLKEILIDSGVQAIVFDGIMDDSAVDMAENIVQLAKAGHCNAIVGFGKRKTQLIARMAAIMAPMRLSAFELLDGRTSRNNFFPVIAIPTDGTDAFSLSEHFIAADPRSGFVKSVRSPGDLFAAVIIDSNLYNFLSEASGAAYLFDGFFEAVEAYCSAKSNFLSDTLLERSINYFAKLIKSGSQGIDAGVYAQACFLASLGNSASSQGAGSALSFALHSRFPVSKQLCSAVLFPYIAEKLVSTRPEKMARVASFLGNTGNPASVADAANSAIGNIRRSMEALKLPADLKQYNISTDRAVAASEEARRLDFIANSPWTVSAEEIFDILKQIL